MRRYVSKFSVAVREQRSERFVYDLIQYMLVMHFQRDPVFQIVDEEERLWFIARMLKVKNQCKSPNLCELTVCRKG